MPNPLSFALFVIGIILLIVFYVVSSLMYQKRHETKYHFYQMFPYEFNYPASFKINFYGNIIFIFGSLAITAFYIINPLSNLYSIVTMIIAILMTMLTICLLLTPLYYLKTHMVLSSLIMTLGVALPTFNIFMAVEKIKYLTDTSSQVICWISLVVSALLALSMILLILNPKLSFKIYMDKAMTIEGEEKLIRPKIIHLALAEWWAIFVYFASPISVLLLLLVK